LESLSTSFILLNFDSKIFSKIKQRKMSFIEMYYYIFYKYYKLCKALKPKLWTPDMIAVLLMMNLIIFLILPIQFYLDIFSNAQTTSSLSLFRVAAVAIFILLIQWLAFWRNDNWKLYIDKFDQWPSDKNERGGLIVAGLTILLFANFIVSLILDIPDK